MNQSREHYSGRKKRHEERPKPARKPPVWRREGWAGPKAEDRPTNAGQEWPEGAVERVVFTHHNCNVRGVYRLIFAELLRHLPYTEYFGTDGWPLCTPEHLKSKLDPRMKAEFRRLPFTCRATKWDEHAWSEAEDYDRHMRMLYQLELMHAYAALLPEPRVYE